MGENFPWRVKRLILFTNCSFLPSTSFDQNISQVKCSQNLFPYLQYTYLARGGIVNSRHTFEVEKKKNVPTIYVNIGNREMCFCDKSLNNEKKRNCTFYRSQFIYTVFCTCMRCDGAYTAVLVKPYLTNTMECMQIVHERLHSLNLETCFFLCQNIRSIQ